MGEGGRREGMGSNGEKSKSTKPQQETEAYIAQKNPDTNGEEESAVVSEVSSFQRLNGKRCPV